MQLNLAMKKILKLIKSLTLNISVKQEYIRDRIYIILKITLAVLS